MWSEAVGLRTIRSEIKKIGLGLGLAGLMCCKTRSVTLVVVIILKNTATFEVLIIVSLFCACNITTVEINSGFYLEVSSRAFVNFR